MPSSLPYEPGDPVFVINEHLAIDHYSDWVRDYIRELKAVQTVQDIRHLASKWSGLIHECAKLVEITEDDLPAFKRFLETTETNRQEWMNIRVPPSTIRLVNAAEHFGAPMGVIFLQLMDHGHYQVEETPNGKVLRLQLPRKPKPPVADESGPEQVES